MNNRKSHSGAWFYLCLMCLITACVPKTPAVALPHAHYIPPGKEPFVKEVFFTYEPGDRGKRCGVTGISSTRDGDRLLRSIVAFDLEGIRFIDPGSRLVRSQVILPNFGGSAALVDCDRNGTPEVLDHQGGFRDVTLMRLTGETLWSRPGSLLTSPGRAANWAAAGDLDGDGTPEFYVATTTGLVCLNAEGRELWTAGEGDIYWHVEVFASDDPSKSQVVSCVQRSASSVEFEFRDANGTLLRRLPRGRLTGAFEVLPWPNHERAFCIASGSGVRFLRPGDAMVYLVDPDLRVIVEYDVPSRLGSVMGVEAEFVRFQPSEPPYIALLADFKRGIRHSLLLIFSLEGDLVHEEILGLGRGLLAVELEGDEAGCQTLLVSDGRGRIVSYRYPRVHQQEPSGEGKELVPDPTGNKVGGSP